MSDIFNRYAPFVQDYIYRNNWNNLRAIQVAAGDAIFNSDQNVLLLSSTASGKTEAAFFPIITLFHENPPTSVGCIYIGPLKALINDQFTRLNDLCYEGDIPVWHWHGDVNQTHKNKLLKNPSGILQITPESLEAMLLHKHAAIPSLFHDLRFVVIDEVHSLLRGDRGGQTLCLIERLSKIANVNPRRIGLSATIGDPLLTGELLSNGTNRKTIIPKIEMKNIKWRLSMEHFYVKDVQASSGKDIKEYLNVLEEKTDTAPKEADPGIGYIFEHTRGKKCLVFVNSREECETITTTLRHYCEIKNENDRFLIHHGNLSASYRETAEEIMKDDNQYQTTITTATLELGIDIGRLERAFQIDAPYTVSSFLQRMGRTGRRDLPPEMWFVIREDEAEPRAMMPSTIPWKLLQGISLIQLYLEEKWVEPPNLNRLPYSLLYHQTMSTLGSCGECTEKTLINRVLSLNYFSKIPIDDYKEIISHLINIDHIQKTENNGLIVGLAGEKIIRSFKFYGVFQEDEEFSVRSESQEIGTIVLPPPVGEKIAIAGHVWTVLEIDRKHHTVYCEQVKGQVPAYFGQCPGDINTKILERMKKVLEENIVYPYLMKNAVARLELSRQVAKQGNLCSVNLINLGGNMWCFIPWLGTYSFLAMERFLKIKCSTKLGLKNFDSSRPFYMQFTMKVDYKTFFEILFEEASKPLNPMEYLYVNEDPLFNKYDEFIPTNLIRKGFAYGVLNIKEMLNRINEWKNSYIK